MFRNKYFLHLLFLFNLILLFIYITSLGPCVINTPTILLVKRGMTTSDIGYQLKQKGVIRSEILFNTFAKLCKLRAIRGEYMFNKRTTILNIVFKLKFGKGCYTLINIPPGSNSWNIQQRFKDFIPQDKFWILWCDKRFTKAAGFPNAINMEGLVAPYIYKVNHAQEPEEIFLKFANTFRNCILPKLNNGKFNPYDTLILASLVEKETSISQEMGLIAGVYAKRLNIGMRLQCDPTLLYARWYSGIMKFSAPNKKDINRINCFNTYKIHGLPPTPIASPGIQAILAAKSPIIGSNIYFAATGDGNHVFASTLTDHNRNVYKYKHKLISSQLGN